MELHQSSGPALFTHNRDFLMLVFPSGLRVRSDNLDPSVFWRKGVQMVALNWQRWDEGMMLNEGMFTGSAGWVLKPKGYLGRRIGNNAPKSESGKTEAGKAGEENQVEAIAHKKLTLVITVLAAQDIPLPLGATNTAGLHPYVKIELHVEKPAERSGAPIEGGGKSKDESEYKQRTRTGKGTDVDFGCDVVRFRDVPGVVEELSFVRYERNKLFLHLQFRSHFMSVRAPLHLLSTIFAYTFCPLQTSCPPLCLLGMLDGIQSTKEKRLGEKSISRRQAREINAISKKHR